MSKKNNYVNTADTAQVLEFCPPKTRVHEAAVFGRQKYVQLIQ